MSDQERTAFEWQLAAAPSEAEPRLAELRNQGADATIERASGVFPIIPIIVGTVLLVGLANAVIDLVHRLHDHGILIDATDVSHIRVTEERGIEYGIIVVITQQGTAEYDTRKSPIDVATLLGALKAGTSGG